MTDTTATPSAKKPEGLDLTQYAYAGFWERFGALCIDFVILVLALAVLVVPLSLAIGVGHILLWPFSAMFGVELTLWPLLDIKVQLLTWLYFSLLESSPMRATLGKKVMGLRVVTEDGKRLSFLRATGRYFGKIVSAAIWMLGFIMAAFTSKKQALHDLLAGTLVVKRKAVSSP